MSFHQFQASQAGAAAMSQCDMGHYWLALQIAFEAGQARVYSPVEPARDGEPFVPTPVPSADSLSQLRRIGT